MSTVLPSQSDRYMALAGGQYATDLLSAKGKYLAIFQFLVNDRYSLRNIRKRREGAERLLTHGLCIYCAESDLCAIKIFSL